MSTDHEYFTIESSSGKNSSFKESDDKKTMAVMFAFDQYPFTKESRSAQNTEVLVILLDQKLHHLATLAVQIFRKSFFLVTYWRSFLQIYAALRSL